MSTLRQEGKITDGDRQFELVVRSIIGTELATWQLSTAVELLDLSQIVVKLPALDRGTYELLSEDATLLDEDGKLRSVLKEAQPRLCITAVVVDMPLEARVARLLRRFRLSNDEAMAEEITKLKLRTADDLDSIVASIFEEVLEHPEVCEPLANLAQVLRSSCPEIPPEQSGGKPATFRRIIMDYCQDMFEAFLQGEARTSADEATAATTARCERLQQMVAGHQGHGTALVHFMGLLYTRAFMAHRTLIRILDRLLGEDELLLEDECRIQSGCILLRAAGPRLVLREVTCGHLEEFAERVEELLATRDESGQPVFAEEYCALMQTTLADVQTLLDEQDKAEQDEEVDEEAVQRARSEA